MTGRRRRLIDSVLAQRQPDLTVLAERLHKPRNFSAIVRTCDSVGINNVHVVPGEQRPRRHWHTSQGAEKWIEVIVHENTAAACMWLKGLEIHWNTSQGAEKWVRVQPHETLAAACIHLRRRGFQLVAAHLSESAVDYRDIDYTVPTALVVGTELFGVSPEALAEADREVRVPMKGMTRSLNVSVACAIVLYEAMRQREAEGLYGRRRLDSVTRERLRFEWMHPSLAQFCREQGVDYPALDADGEVVGSVPRGGPTKSRL